VAQNFQLLATDGHDCLMFVNEPVIYYEALCLCHTTLPGNKSHVGFFLDVQ
jgi:hypothetical protein